jgi:hypothetical protein
MITFLVTLAAFHFYNFLVNKDDISRKVLDDNDLKKSTEMLDKISKIISEFNKQIVHIKIRHNNLLTIKPCSTLNESLLQAYGNIITENTDKIDKFNNEYNDIKKINIIRDFNFGHKTTIFINYFVTIVYILSLISYFISGSIKDGIFLYAAKIMDQKHFFHASEVFFYLCFCCFLWEIYLTIKHKTKYQADVKSHYRQATELFDNLSIAQNKFDKFEEAQFKILEEDLDPIPF